MADTKIEINCTTGEKTIVNKSSDEVTAKQSRLAAQLADNVREKRNALLAETDYLALADLTMSSQMTAYRQQLREVPQQSEFPATISWPTKP